MGNNLGSKWEFGSNYCVFYDTSVALDISNYHNFKDDFVVILQGYDFFKLGAARVLTVYFGNRLASL